MEPTFADFTVVVPTRDEQGNIGRFIDSIPKELNLIVVDASDDETASLTLRLRPERTTVLLKKDSNIPVARQIGGELANTEWLIYSDADVVFHADYFKNLAHYAKDFDVVYGPKLSLDAYRAYYARFTAMQRFFHSIKAPIASGSNLAVKRSVLLAGGGFDPDLYCNEDTELVWRLGRAGYRIAFAEDLPVYAIDHRRLARGQVRKTLHSFVRCFLIYFGLVPSIWRHSDWGYWSERDGARRKPDRPA